jgi:transcriptional regulator with XRE-family HTH domain
MNDNTNNASLGTFLKEARARAGLSIRDLERVSGVANSYLTKLELNQKTNPSADILQRLADALDLDASELLAFIGVKPASTLPAARTYFRRKYGVNAKEADVLTRLVEDHVNRKVGPYEETDEASDEPAH